MPDSLLYLFFADFLFVMNHTLLVLEFFTLIHFFIAWGKKPPSGIFMIFMRILHSWNPWHLKAAFCYLGSNSSDGLHPALLGSMFVPCLREMLEGHSTLFFPGFLSLANQSSCLSLGTGWSCEADVLMSPSSQGVWAHWFNSVSVSWVPTVCQMLWEPLEVKRIKGTRFLLWETSSGAVYWSEERKSIMRWQVSKWLAR